MDGHLLGLYVDCATFVSEFPLLVRTPVLLGQNPSYDLILTSYLLKDLISKYNHILVTLGLQHMNLGVILFST